MQIYKDFTFEAAFRGPASRGAGASPVEPSGVTGPIYGHSFAARVWVTGRPDPETGTVLPFETIAAACADACDVLDHRLLNDVEGLSNPTLEAIAVWLWNHLSPRLPGLTRVEVCREANGEGCVYDGPDGKI